MIYLSMLALCLALIIIMFADYYYFARIIFNTYLTLASYSQ